MKKRETGKRPFSVGGERWIAKSIVVGEKKRKGGSFFRGEKGKGGNRNANKETSCRQQGERSSQAARRPQTGLKTRTEEKNKEKGNPQKVERELIKKGGKGSRAEKASASSEGKITSHATNHKKGTKGTKSDIGRNQGNKTGACKLEHAFRRERVSRNASQDDRGGRASWRTERSSLESRKGGIWGVNI